MEAIIIAKQEYDQILVKLDEIREGLHKQVNPSPIQERYLTNTEVCDLLKVSRRTDVATLPRRRPHSVFTGRCHHSV